MGVGVDVGVGFLFFGFTLAVLGTYPSVQAKICFCSRKKVDFLMQKLVLDEQKLLFAYAKLKLVVLSQKVVLRHTLFCTIDRSQISP